MHKIHHRQSKKGEGTFVLVWILHQVVRSSSFQYHYAGISKQISPLPFGTSVTRRSGTHASFLHMSSSSSFESMQFSDDESDLSSTSVSSKEITNSHNTENQIPINTTENNAMVHQKSSNGTVAKYGVPTYRTLMVFVSITILIWLSEPLLSLVDTTVIGQSSASNAVLQLAALGPATMLIDSGIYMFYFLSIATTNIMAPALAKKDYKKLQTTASHVMGVAAVLGSLITLTVFSFGKPLLEWVAGTSSSPELIRLALAYSQIRSMAAPFAILGCVTQSICLATLDTLTPAIAVAAACVINVFGDIWLVTKCNIGIEGAAIATATASVASSMILLLECRRKMIKWRCMTHPDTSTPMSPSKSTVSSDPSSDSYDDNDSTTTMATNLLATNGDRDETSSPNGSKNMNRENLNGEGNGKQIILTQNPIPFMSFPDQNALIQLVKLSGPIFFVMVGKIMCYSSMTLRATDFGVLALACHNVMMRIYFFYGTFGDSMGQAVQSFLPQVIFKDGDGDKNDDVAKGTEDGSISNNEKETDNKRGLKILLLRLGILATSMGLASSQVGVWILKYCGSYFTRDTSMMTMMSKHTEFFGLSLLLHPFIMLFEGAIIATRDLPYLCFSYLVTMILLLSQLRFATSSFGGVWRALFVFQILRATLCSTRFFLITVRRKKVAQALHNCSSNFKHRVNCRIMFVHYLLTTSKRKSTGAGNNSHYLRTIF